MEVLRRLQNQYPEIATLSHQELHELMVYCNSVLTGENMGRSCASSYTGDIGDCLDNFAVEAAVTVIVAAAATAFGTPLAGALSLGMGAAHMHDIVCRSSAARHYRECMGYE